MVSAARLTVLGSLNMDISVTVPVLPAPGATVLGGAATFAPGGKGANQAVAAARLAAGSPGIHVRIVGCVGDDDFGRALLVALQAEGVDDSSVRTVPGIPTGIAMITVDRAGENIITVAPGANREPGPAEIAAACDTRVPAGPGTVSAAADAADPAVDVTSDVIVLSAEIPVPVIRAVLDGTSARDGTRSVRQMIRMLNLAPAPPEAAELVAARPDWLVVNESEAAAILGRPVSGLTEAAKAAADLVARGTRNAVVTAGAAGAAYCGPAAGAHETADGTNAAVGSNDAVQPSDAGPRTVVTVPGFKVDAVDTVGAGDTFVGALAVALAVGVPPKDAVTAASAAGATAATRPGTQTGMPRPADVQVATGYRWPVDAGR